MLTLTPSDALVAALEVSTLAAALGREPAVLAEVIETHATPADLMGGVAIAPWFHEGALTMTAHVALVRYFDGLDVVDGCGTDDDDGHPEPDPTVNAEACAPTMAACGSTEPTLDVPLRFLQGLAQAWREYPDADTHAQRLRGLADVLDMVALISAGVPQGG